MKFCPTLLLLGAFCVGGACFAQEAAPEPRPGPTVGATLGELTEGWRYYPGSSAEATCGAEPVLGLHPGSSCLSVDEGEGSRYGTFRIRLAPVREGADYGIAIPAVNGAYRLYVDGTLLCERGAPSADASAYEPYAASSVSPLPTGDQPIDIALELATHGFFRPGASEPVTIGPRTDLAHHGSRTMALLLCTCGILLAMGFGIMASSVMADARKEDVRAAGLILTVSLYVLISDRGLLAELWHGMPFWFVYRLQLLSMFASVCMSWAYAGCWGGAKPQRHLMRASRLGVYVLGGLALVSPLWHSGLFAELWALPVALGTVTVLADLARRPGWHDRATLLARAAMFALAIAILCEAARAATGSTFFGLAAVAGYFVFALGVGIAFLTQLVDRNGELLAEARASDAKSQFMSRVSHELRTPLHGVQGSLDLLADSQLDAEQSAIVRAATTSAKGMQAIVEGLLEFDELLAGTLRVEERPARLPCVLREAIDIASAIGGHDVERVDLDLTQDLGTVSCDCQRVREIVTQLVSNAFKYGTPGARIGVRLSREGNTFAVSVRSAGKPLSAEEVAAAMQPFSQRERYWQRTSGGLGIGLAVADQLAVVLGGRLEHRAETEANVFVLTLPLEPAAGNPDAAGSSATDPVKIFTPAGDTAFAAGPRRLAAASTSPAAPNLAIGTPSGRPHRLGHGGEGERADRATESPPLHCLVVEDHPLNQKLVATMLKRWGHTSRVCENGQVALDALEAGERFDIVLMDLQMPIMDGLTATRRMRESVAPTQLPIVALTANASPADRAACAEAGMQSFVAKPFKADDLASAMAEALGRSVRPASVTSAVA